MEAYYTPAVTIPPQYLAKYFIIFQIISVNQKTILKQLEWCNIDKLSKAGNMASTVSQQSFIIVFMTCIFFC